jgi:hypothetical protein
VAGRRRGARSKAGDIGRSSIAGPERFAEIAAEFVRQVMQLPWLQSLKRLAEEKRLVIIRFDEAEWQSLNELSRLSSSRWLIFYPLKAAALAAQDGYDVIGIVCTYQDAPR